MLLAPRWRADVPPAEQGRGTIDQGRGALERRRHAPVHAEARLWPLAALQHAQGEWVLGGIERMRGWLRWAVLCGSPWLFAHLGLPIPGTQRGSGRRAGQPAWEGDWGGTNPSKTRLGPPSEPPLA